MTICTAFYPTGMDFHALPKAELHCHLEACFRHPTLIELGRRQGLEVPSDPSEFAKTWLVTEQMNDLASVLQAFGNVQSVWGHEEAIERLTYEACEDAYRQNILILELRYALTFILQGHPNLNFEKIQDAIVRGAARARRDFPMAIGLIGILQRTNPLSEATTVVDFMIERREQFVGIDLADAEVGFDCVPFAPLFERARQAGLHVTVHSGEEDVPEAPQFVRNAIEHLGAERIGHGLQIIKDPATVDFVRERGLPLELCPTSNWLTHAVPTTAAHPIRQLMDAGVEVTINSDDPDIFGLSLTSEYELLAREHAFTPEDFTRCNDSAARHSFIPHAEKAKVWPRKIKQG